jgi:8-oxo-dGTP diphosphatase
MTSIEKIYGNKIRVRVCGVLLRDNKVLLINHSSLNPENIFWHFPGLEPDEDVISALKREFSEETNLHINTHEFLHLNQFIKGKLHAIELFFRVSSSTLDPDLGNDPELNILTDLKWFTLEELEKLPLSHRSNFIKEIAFN